MSVLKAVIPQAQTGGGGSGGVAVSAGTNSFSSGTINFSNANGVTFGMDAASNLTASVSPSAANLALSAGTQSVNSGTINFANSNGISFGMSGSSQITASYTVPSTTGLLSNINVSAGTTSNNLSALTFSNSNGISFGLNASTLTASYTVPTQTNQTLGLYASSNTTGASSSSTYDARSLSMEFLGNISGGWSNGSFQVSVSTAAQTNQTGAIYASSQTTGASSSSTYDARSLSIEGLGGVSVGWSNGTFQISGATGGGAGGVAISAGTQSDNTGTVVFSNSNGISFGMSNSSVVTASYTVPTQTNQTLGIYASSQTVGQSSSSTYDARSLSLVGQGIISAGWSNSSLLISATQSAQTEGWYMSGNTTGQSTSSTFDARSITLSGAGAASVGESAGKIIISVPTQGATGAFTAGVGSDGNTGGSTGGVSLSIEFVGTNGITLSQSTNGNSATISISGGGGGGGATLSNYIWPPAQLVATQAFSLNVSNRVSFQYLPLYQNLSLTRAAGFITVSCSTTNNNSTNTFAITVGAGLYSVTGSSLSSISTGSQTYSLTWSSNATSSAGGAKLISVPLSTNLVPGEYIIAYSQSTSSSGVGVSMSNIGYTNFVFMQPAPFNSVSNSTYGFPIAIGVISSGNTSLASSYALSNINQGGNIGAQANLLFQLGATSVWG